MLNTPVAYWIATVAKTGDKEHPIFLTAAMAEILLQQSMLTEARHIIDQLLENAPENPRYIALDERLQAMVRQGELEPTPIATKNNDYIHLRFASKVLHMEWEVHEESIALAKRKTRYGGQAIVRLFSAVPGPRGVRTSTKDTLIEIGAAQLAFTGLPFPAVHVAAVGFLSKTGAFVPLAQSKTVVASNDISNETP